MRGLTLLLLLFLQACGMVPSFIEDEPTPELTIAELQPVIIPQAGESLAKKSLDELAELYAAVLPLTDDPQIRLSVQHRLADIRMLSDEEKLANTDANEGLFAGAIAAYEQLLAENPDSPLEDQFMYQLSKAYELSGDNKKSLAVLEQLSSEHPDSWYFTEAEFRRAESSFIAGNYPGAESAYSRVIDSGESSVYYSKALYMQGWSRFKQAKYTAAVASFTENLDVLMPANGRVEALPRSDRELVDDSFRVLAVIFSYLGGADAIAAAMDQLGERDYQYLLYQNLGDLYLKQERYRDSAETFKAYVVHYPDSGQAHQLQIKVIGAYEEGGFPELVVEEKQFYVATFEVRGSSWLRSDWATRNAIDEKQQVFIPELARHFHALAQQSAKKPDGKVSALENYKLAASYYQLYVDSFPKSPQVPDMGYMLAQSQYESGNYQQAIESYDWVAYRFPKFEKATDSAYAAITTYNKLESEDTDTFNEEWLDKRIDTELRFVREFVDDARAPGVLGHASKGLLDRGEYRAAVKSASQLVQWRPAPGQEIITPAWLVLGHSYFELADYIGAEEAYQGALALLQKTDARYLATFERLAASVYKQGERAAERGKYAKAAEEFSRVLLIAPESKISMNAQFDAAQYYTKAGDYAEANRLLKDFRLRYSGNPLTASIPLVMVGNYEALGDWGKAAQELDALYADEADPDTKRDYLYLAAEYYDKAGVSDTAILRYRSYAHAYEQPFGIRMEAMNRLSELYSDAGAGQKQRFWLARIIASHDGAGTEKNERSLFLAASASSVLADDAFNAYRNLELRIPLKKSLKRKKSAMAKAVDAYNKINGYGVEQFSTLATYRLARIYQQLGTDLMSSQRPSNLDELAMEQYDLLLEEQAYPFEEKAIAIYQTNARRSWDGVYDAWVKKSFSALAELMPARYAKAETKAKVSEDIY